MSAISLAESIRAQTTERLVDMLGAVRTEAAEADGREKAIRAELVAREVQEAEGRVYKLTIGSAMSLDARRRGCEGRDGRRLVHRPFESCRCDPHHRDAARRSAGAGGGGMTDRCMITDHERAMILARIGAAVAAGSLARLQIAGSVTRLATIGSRGWRLPRAFQLHDGEGE